MNGNVSTVSRRVGMADEADSKSVVGNHVWVQVPSPALNDANLNKACGSDLAPSSAVIKIAEKPVKSMVLAIFYCYKKFTYFVMIL